MSQEQHADKPCADPVCMPGMLALPSLVQVLPDPRLDPEVAAAFDTAYANIAAFHKAQLSAPLEVETMAGVRCRRVSRPIGAVGLYVPGGTAVLPSSALMLAVPAAIAGCHTIVLASPPRADGSITPEVLYCARKAGVTHVLMAGGAQAVAAMAWGTASCPKVDKILGPGNQYVTAAKMLLQNSEAMVAIDMPAGPSEVLVIADAGASPTHVAIDLLSQVLMSYADEGVCVCIFVRAVGGMLFDVDESGRRMGQVFACLHMCVPAHRLVAQIAVWMCQTMGPFVLRRLSTGRTVRLYFWRCLGWMWMGCSKKLSGSAACCHGRRQRGVRLPIAALCKWAARRRRLNSQTGPNAYRSLGARLWQEQQRACTSGGQPNTICFDPKP